MGTPGKMYTTSVPPVEKNVTNNKMEYSVIYVHLKCGLYKCINNVLLFWEKSSEDLKPQGFKLNPYVPCVTYKPINDNQFTIVWHVDRLEIVPEDLQEVTKMIKWIENKYGKY